jgi:heme-degrading monooxygenase HmoA
MVIERADLSIISGRESEFETVMQHGCKLLRSAPGCISVTLSRCIERPQRYELALRWEAMADHTAFTQTDQFMAFRTLAGPFFSERPLTEHYQLIDQAP